MLAIYCVQDIDGFGILGSPGLEDENTNTRKDSPDNDNQWF